MAIHYLIKPQKPFGSGWVDVKPSNGCHWAVVKRTTWRVTGRTIKSDQILARYQSSRKADEHRDNLAKNSKLGRVYRLGKRMPPREERIGG